MLCVVVEEAIFIQRGGSLDTLQGESVFQRHSLFNLFGILHSGSFYTSIALAIYMMYLSVNSLI